jgi:hypothetical protein
MVFVFDGYPLPTPQSALLIPSRTAADERVAAPK